MLPLVARVVCRHHAGVAGTLSCRSASHQAEAAVELCSEWQSARPYDEIPGPKPLPVVGNIWRFLPRIGDLFDANFVNVHRKLNARYGDLVKVSHILGRRDLLFLFRPDDIAHVLRSESTWPWRPALESLAYYRKVTRKQFFQGLGGVLTDQGESWQEARTQVNPVLLQTKTVQLYTQRVNDVADDFVSRIPDWRDEKGEMRDSFKNDLHKWALESIAVVALDARLGCLEPNLAADSEPQRMIDAVHTMFECLHALETQAHTWKLVSTPAWRKFVRTLDYFVDVSMKYITRAMERMEQGEKSSVLARFLERDPNPTRAVIMALDMLMAGVDTTSYSLANTLLDLSANQDKQERLYEELERIMPDPSAPITTEMLNDMKYLRATIKESMRLQPIASANARRSTKEIVLSNYRIPVGVDMILVNAALCRMDRYFPQANSFVPERWLRQADQCPFPDFKPNPYAFLPFGHGSRKCVGMRFAALEMEVMLAKLVRRYNWQYHHGKMSYKSSLIQVPVDPLRFTVTPR